MLRALWDVLWNLEDKNVKSSTEDGGLVCEILEGILKTLSGPFAISNYDPSALLSWGSRINYDNKITELLQQCFALLGYFTLINWS